MRLSEKSIELNFCAQVGRRMGQHVFWFGLTQAQEAIAGFDLATRVGGRVLLFQIKASRTILKRSGARQFMAPHDQLRSLQQRAHVGRGVFYVLPDFGTTAEVAKLKDPLARTWLFDVSQIPDPFPPPTVSRTGARRKSGFHYFDLEPPTLTIKSEPVSVGLLSAARLIDLGFFQDGGVPVPRDSNRWTDEVIHDLRAPFSWSAVGAVIA